MGLSIVFPHQGIYLEEYAPAGNNFVVCALVTPEHDRYVRCADRLANSCRKFLLPYAIYKVPAVHKSVNLNGTENAAYTKAFFILFNLNRFRDKSVVYVDVDMVFVDNPEKIFEISNRGYDFAIYNWLQDKHNEAYVPILREVNGRYFFSEFYQYSHHIDLFSPTQLICSGGVQFYKNSPAAVRLLETWQQIIEENPGVADDECLDYAYNNEFAGAGEMKAAWLEKSYLRLPWWPYVRPVILHPEIPLAGGGRPPLTGRRGKKRFYPERCTRKNDPLYFPPDSVIDTKRNLLLQMKNSRVVETIQLQQEFWIYQENDEGTPERRE